MPWPPSPYSLRRRRAKWGTICLSRKRSLAGCTPDPSAGGTLLGSARAGDSRVVVRPDRPGRSRHERIDSVVTLQGRRINRVSLKEGIDTTSATGSRFQVLGAIAHFERRRISECTKDGLRDGLQ